MMKVLVFFGMEFNMVFILNVICVLLLLKDMLFFIGVKLFDEEVFVIF